ncbi:aldo/keto reductase [Phlyctema vagabunda]|uniref:Aldo/keto reductase n=1 Tax=Phlyctema vagabunda TaxID=108571 RepID=A0ABR4PBV6_9HELO
MTTTLLGKQIGSTGYGLMGLTWRPTPQSEEKSFEAMRASLEAGCNFWNAGEFYGTPENNSLTLLEKYFAKYPEDAEKVVLSVKGAVSMQTGPNGSKEYVQASIDNCLRMLKGRKSIDIFECARVDPKTPIETTMKALEEYVQAGKIGGIALSEVGAKTVQRAVKVTKIVAVEVEVSLWSMDVFENGVAKACAEHNIPIVAYSPLGRGMLTGEIKSPSDIPEGDMRKTMPRFLPENFNVNIKLVEEIKSLAETKGCTPGQLAISYVKQLSKRPGNPEFIPIPGATSPSRVKENGKNVELSTEEVSAIDSILSNFKTKGGRYHEAHSGLLEG